MFRPVFPLKKKYIYIHFRKVSCDIFIIYIKLEYLKVNHIINSHLERYYKLKQIKNII